MLLDKKLAKRTVFSEPGEKQAMIDLASSYADVISLGRGDPDIVTPELFREAGIAAIKRGETGYTKWAGIPKLRAAIAKRYTDKRNVPTVAEEVMVTVGAQEAVFLAMMAFIDPGDEVIIFEPRYTPYDMAIDLVGGKLVSLPTYEEDGFVVKPELIEAAITPQTKAILIISPNNPTGSVVPATILSSIAKIAIEHDLLVISDELYSDLVFDGETATSIASLPGMKERTVVINGFSKSYCMTGWRIGYLIASPHVIKLLTEMKSVVTICAPNFCQHAALTAIEQGDGEIEKVVAIYDERRIFVMDALDKLGVPYHRPRGTFYLFVNIKSLLKEGERAFDFTKGFLSEEKVLIFPGTIFGRSGEGYVRISLLQPMDQLEEAMRRLTHYIKTQRG